MLRRWRQRVQNHHTQVLPLQVVPPSHVLPAQQVQPGIPHLCGQYARADHRAPAEVAEGMEVTRSGAGKRAAPVQTHPTSVVTPMVAPPPLFACLPRAVRLSVRILKSSAAIQSQLEHGCGDVLIWRQSISTSHAESALL